jgi:hypothetical protein
MQLTCPCCGVDFPIEAGMTEGDGKRLAALLAGVEAELGRALVSYLRLHKPAKTALRMARAAKLAGELIELVRAGVVRRGHMPARPAPAALWCAGVEALLAKRDKLRLPLHGHGYLLEIVYGLAEQAEAAAERAREEHARRGHRPGATPAPGPSLLEQLSRLRGDRDLGLIDEAEYQRRAEALRGEA